jgi:hypothetical protein
VNKRPVPPILAASGGEVKMREKIHPAVAAVIVVVAVIGIGLLGWKLFIKPSGVAGKIPASASNPNGGNPTRPTHAPRVGLLIDTPDGRIISV